MYWLEFVSSASASREGYGIVLRTSRIITQPSRNRYRDDMFTHTHFYIYKTVGGVSKGKIVVVIIKIDYLAFLFSVNVY